MSKADILDLLKSDPSDVMRRFTSDLDHSERFQKYSSDKWFRYYRKYRGKHDEKFLAYRADRYSIFVPLLFSLIENIVPRFVLGTFGSYPFINISPVGIEDVEASKKAEKLLNQQLANDNIMIKAPGWFKQLSMYGTSPAKVIWAKKTAVIPTKGKKSREVVKYMGPSLIPLDVMDLKIDPRASDLGIESASYIIHTVLLSEDEMKDRIVNAKKYGYDFSGIDIMGEGISGNSELWDKFQRERSLGISQRESPDRKYWRFDEYWTPEAVVTILNKREIVRRSPNLILDYPFINLNRNPLLGEFYGIGDIECVEDLMDEINYIRNLRLDNMDILVNGVFLKERAAQINDEEVVARPGKVINTNDIQGFKQLVFADVTGPARTEEEKLKQELQETSGIIDMMKGNLDRSNIPAAGMAMLIESASYRIRLGLLMIEHYGIRQIGEKFMRLNYLNLPDDYIIRIVGDKDWLKLKTPDEIFGNFDYIPSGSSEFLNKETLKQSVLQLYNLLARDPSVDQVGLKKLVAMAFGGRLVESILMGKGGQGGVQEAEGEVEDQAEGGVEEPENVNQPQDESGVIQKENQMMIDGQEVPPVGDHRQHIPGHIAITQEPEFAQMASGIQGIFGRHIQGHMRAAQMGGEPLEDPNRMSAQMGMGHEEMMKRSLQKPIPG